MRKFYFVITTLGIYLVTFLGAFSCGGANVPPAQGPNVPPHVKIVQPPDGVTVAHEAIINVTLDLQAGQGVSSNPESSGVSLYLDGERITDTVWTVEGQPPTTGFIKARTEPGRGYVLSPGKRIFEICYKDLAGQQWSFSWQVTVWDVPTPTKN